MVQMRSQEAHIAPRRRIRSTRRVRFPVTRSKGPSPKVRPVHIVDERGTEGMHHGEYGGRNAQHMVGNAADVVVTIILSRCAEVDPPARARQGSMKMPTLTRYALSPWGVVLDHHLYHESSDAWVKEPSHPQPYIKLLVRVQREDCERFGFVPQANWRAITVHAMADTGCQSCLVGISTIHKLGLREHSLIPVKMRMRAANNNSINILGAAILRFSGQDEAGNVVERPASSPMSLTRLIGYFSVKRRA